MCVAVGGFSVEVSFIQGCLAACKNNREQEPRLISALGLASLAGFRGWDAHMKNTRSVLSSLAHSDETHYHHRLQPPRSIVASAGFMCSSTSPSRISGVRVGS